MKATERHRLKQNDLGVFARQTREAVDQWKGQLTWLTAIVALAALVVLGFGAGVDGLKGARRPRSPTR